MRRRSKKARIISGILAAAMLSSILIGAGYGIISQTNRRRKPVQPSQMNEEPYAPDEAERYIPTPEEEAVRLLSTAVEEKDSAVILACTDEITAYIQSELEKLDASPYTGDDPEMKQRREAFELSVRTRAAAALAAAERIRSGHPEEGDTELLERIVYGDTAMHRSNAAANSAPENSSPDTVEETEKQETKAEEKSAGEADYSEYLSTDIPEKVADMAKQLGSAIEIYRYVRNSVAYEAYAGSKKGALVTLEQLGGNDVDQSCLLIQMLRSAGIPARFVKGHVQITAEQAVAVTGAADAESAGRILSARYKDVKGVTNNGVLTGYIMEHVWTEALVPYTDYRGAGKQSGDALWIPLDPAFKELNVESGDFEETFSEQQEKVMRDAEELAEKYPAMYREGYAYDNRITLYSRTIIENNDIYLPVTLPYEVISEDERFADVSGTDTEDRLTVEINGEILLDKPLPELYYDQIFIHYIPAGEEDQKLLEQYGSLTDVPAYMMNVVPEIVLSRDNQTAKAVTGKKAAMLGTMQKMLTTIRNGGGTTILTDDVFCGSVYAVNLDYQMITVGDADFAQARIKRAELEAGENDPLSPTVAGAFLDYAGKYYFALCDNDAAALEHVYNVQRNRQLGLAFTGYEFRPESVLGITEKLSTGSFFIDAAYNNYSAVSFDGSKRNEICFNSALCASESYNEGSVWEVLTDDTITGISTLTVFDAAAEKGIPTPYIFAENAEEQLEKCSVSETVKNEVRDYVNQGYAVRLVSENITIGTWTGTAYTVTDLRTGVASYMLSDGTAGGRTVDFDLLFQINMALFKMNLALSAVSLAEATVKVHCPGPVTQFGGALQAIDAGKALARGFQIYYDSVFWICDCATGDPAKLEEFKQFTLENIEGTLDYMKSLMEGAAFDILGGTASIMKLTKLETLLNIKTVTYDAMNTLTSGPADEPYYDDTDWLDEFTVNPFQVVLDQLNERLGRFFN